MTFNPFELMKNAKEMQSHLTKLQNEAENITVEGVSGGGLVKITLNGRFAMKKIELDPITVDDRDIIMLQDLIRSAYTDAMEKMQETLKDKMGPLASLLGDVSLS
ncbi:MAG: YbaB/EbfC family nucleoid-associated protein [Treponema sp.]